MEFTHNEITYRHNETSDRYSKTENGKTCRVGKDEFAEALQQHMDEEDAKRRDVIQRAALERENKEIERIQKEVAKKAVRVGGMEFAEDGISVVLTEKQVKFIQRLPQSAHWERGLDSALWIEVLCDELCDEMGPMTVGAMVSTLREKHLLIVGVGQYAEEGSKGHKAKYFEFTETGKNVAAKVLGC